MTLTSNKGKSEVALLAYGLSKLDGAQIGNAGIMYFYKKNGDTLKKIRLFYILITQQAIL